MIKDSKIPFLDGMRGFAALLVIAAHIFPAFVTKNTFLASCLETTSHSAVELFFVLSGFLISGQFWQNEAKGSDFNFRDYFFRRGLRILPLFYISFLVFFLFHLLEYGAHYPRDMYDIIPYYLFQVHNFFADVNVLNPPTWTVAVEIHFYLFIALYFYLLRKVTMKGKITGIFILFLFVIAYRYVVFAYIDTPGEFRDLYYANSLARMDHFFIGMLVAVLFHTPGMQDRFRNMAPLVFIGGVLLHQGMIWTEYRYGMNYLIMVNVIGVLTAFAWGLIICSGILGFHFTTSLFSFQPLRFCGDISYSLYLLHLPVYTFFYQPFCRKFLPGYDLTTALSFFPFIIGLAWLSYRLVERPFLKLKLKYRQF